MAAEHLEKVFEPGYTGWDVGVGVGLGLPACESIVADHQGCIDITSTLGVGTTVTVEIPVNL